MAGYEKRGEEEDIAEIVRKKLDKIREKPFKKEEIKPKEDFGRRFQSIGETLLKKEEIKPKKDFGRRFQSIGETLPKKEEIKPKEDFGRRFQSIGETLPKKEEIKPKEDLEDLRIPIGEPILEAPETSPPSPVNEPASIKPRSGKLPKVILTLSIIVFLLAVLIVAFVLFWMYRDSTDKSRPLYVNEGLQSAVVNGEESVYIILSGDLDIDKISGVTIVFSSSDNSEHPYSPTFISREYDINASELNLESFKDVLVARAFFDYKPSLDQGNGTADLSGSAATIGPFVRFWETVRDFLGQ